MNPAATASESCIPEAVHQPMSVRPEDCRWMRGAPPAVDQTCCDHEFDDETRASGSECKTILWAGFPNESLLNR